MSSGAVGTACPRRPPTTSRRTWAPADPRRGAQPGVLRPLGLLALLAACTGDPKVENRLPEAKLEVNPPIARVGDVVVFDANGSRDQDGSIVLYRFLFPDGTGETPSAVPRVEHRFPRSGDFQAAVVVVDDEGGEGRAAVRVTVLAQPPAPCRSDLECRVGEVCLAGRCRNDPCGPDRPCAPPLQCRGGECVPPAPPPGCRVDADCTASRVCRTGACACPGTLADCSGSCIDTRSSSNHCGACFNTCPAGATCTAGACAARPTCTTDRDCQPDRRCVGGACACAPGRTACDDACADLVSDSRHCGACGRACSGGQTCTAAACIDRPVCARDADCSGGRFCAGGTCACPVGLAFCGEACRDLAADARHCGGCFKTCGPSERCEAGVCRA